VKKENWRYYTITLGLDKGGGRQVGSYRSGEEKERSTLWGAPGGEGAESQGGLGKLPP